MKFRIINMRAEHNTRFSQISALTRRKVLGRTIALTSAGSFADRKGELRSRFLLLSPPHSTATREKCTRNCWIMHEVPGGWSSAGRSRRVHRFRTSGKQGSDSEPASVQIGTRSRRITRTKARPFISIRDRINWRESVFGEWRRGRKGMTFVPRGDV